jgi:two-component system response regulator ChvI
MFPPESTLEIAEFGDPSDRRRLVLVDDDPLFLKSLALNFEDAGYQVLTFTGGAAALDHLTASGVAVDAFVLDWHMPGMDGIDLLERLRAGGSESPAMILTSLSQPMFEELALDRGAVDFVDKTRSFTVILKRLELVLSGVKGGAKPMPATEPEAEAKSGGYGPLQLNADSCRAHWRGRAVPLTLTEYRVVSHLAAKAATDVSYREIYDLVRGEGFIAGPGADGYRANVRTLIKRIRQKFRDLDPEFSALENYPGFGYRWRNDEPH